MLIDKRHVLQIMIICIIAIISGLLYNFMSPEGIPLVYHPPQMESGALLTSEQAYQLYRNGRALFIDARSADEYNENHISNAFSLPINSSRDELNTLIEPLSKDRLIVVYCSNPGCNSSRRLAGLLSYLGFKRVFIYLPGLEEWRSKSYPTETVQVSHE